MNNEIKNEVNSFDNKQLTIVITISKLLKVSEAAHYLNMSESSLQELLTKGEIPSINVNGEIHIREYELWDWMYKQNPIMIKNENPLFDIYANLGADMKTHSIDELLKDKTEPPKALIGDGILLQNDMLLITGAKKSRKTFLAYNLGLALTIGKSFAGFNIETKNKY